MTLSQLAARRYTTKAFDAARKLPQETVEELLTLLRLAPSSVNSQPWHFIVADSDEGKARIAEGAPGNFAYNAAKILNASHVIVLCRRTELSDSHLEAILAQEQADGRFANEEARSGQQKSRAGYVALHRKQGDTAQWMEKQVYLALGSLLLGASVAGIDATPMEGFDPVLLDQALGLADAGLTSVVIVALGYHSEGDFNAALPKSRLPADAVITRL